MLGKLLSYLKGMVINPEATLKHLHEDRMGIAYSFLAVTGFLFLYTIIIYLTVLFGGTVDAAPWIAVPAETYYHFQLFIQWPVFLSLMVLLAGLIYVFSKSWDLRGSYDDCLKAAGFIMAVPGIFVTVLFNTILLVSFLTGTYSIKAWAAFASTAQGTNFILMVIALAFLWGAELTFAAVREFFSAPKLKAAIISIAATLIGAFFTLTYIR